MGIEVPTTIVIDTPPPPKGGRKPGSVRQELEAFLDRLAQEAPDQWVLFSGATDRASYIYNYRRTTGRDIEVTTRGLNDGSGKRAVWIKVPAPVAADQQQKLPEMAVGDPSEMLASIRRLMAAQEVPVGDADAI